jgi:hypothetical protein
MPSNADQPEWSELHATRETSVFAAGMMELPAVAYHTSITASRTVEYFKRALFLGMYVHTLITNGPAPMNIMKGLHAPDTKPEMPLLRSWWWW